MNQSATDSESARGARGRFAAGNPGGTNGHFTPGNPGGPGNPQAAKVARLRTALLDAITEEDIAAAVKAMVQECKAGNIAACRELFDRTMGKPLQADVLEKIEELEQTLERLAENAANKSH